MRDALISALQWHLEAGADEALADQPVISARAPQPQVPPARSVSLPSPAVVAAPVTDGVPEAIQEAIRLAAAAKNIDALRAALLSFEGLSIKKTATNMVFCDGNPRASIMIVGDAPDTDDDRQGKPFSGASGLMLDRILGSIGLDRRAEDPANSAYLANILNWRPPGNRTPTEAELDLCRPFIERHIALVRPRLILLAGAVAAQTLLKRTEGISRLRGEWHRFSPVTPGILEGLTGNGNGGDLAVGIPMLATYHPSYLLRTPTQKQAVWQDMLILSRKIKELA